MCSYPSAPPIKAAYSPVRLVSLDKARGRGNKSEVHTEREFCTLHVALYPSLEGLGGPVTENSLTESDRELHISTVDGGGVLVSCGKNKCCLVDMVKSHHKRVVTLMW